MFLTLDNLKRMRKEYINNKLRKRESRMIKTTQFNLRRWKMGERI